MTDAARELRGVTQIGAFGGKTAQESVPLVKKPGTEGLFWMETMDTNDARSALIAECAGAIVQIERSSGMKTCDAHDGLAHGVVVLLRCRIAMFQREVEEAMAWKSARAKVIAKVVGWGLAVLGSGLFAAWVMYMKVAAFMVEHGGGP